MIKMAKKDEYLLDKIKKELQLLNSALPKAEKIGVNSLEFTMEGSTVTRCIINIYNYYHMFNSDEILKELIKLGNNSMRVARNIAAHDYESVDWNRLLETANLLVNLSKNTGLWERCEHLAKDTSGYPDLRKLSLFTEDTKHKGNQS